MKDPLINELEVITGWNILHYIVHLCLGFTFPDKLILI